MDIGPRIKLARAKARMSIHELAEAVGVSATAISKFERGEATPRQSTLLRLAKALSVGVEYFFREVKVETLAPAYRKHSKLGRHDQEAIEATIVETVERHLAVEQLLSEGTPLPSDRARFSVSTVEDAEEAAEGLRATWNLGGDAINDLCGRLEDHGVKVIALEGPEGFDGFSCWANGLIPVIAFNANTTGDRQRFSLAHELGHLVLDPVAEIDIEKTAHRFAGAFLVPAQTVYAELGRKRSNLGFAELLMLKREYGMSIQAWIMRAFDLSIIDERTYSALYRKLSVRGWRKEEPDGVRKETPQRLRLLVYQALAENLITPSYAATLLDEQPQGRARPSERAFAEPSERLARQYVENPELTAFIDVDLEDFNEKDQ